MREPVAICPVRGGSAAAGPTSSVEPWDGRGSRLSRICFLNLQPIQLSVGEQPWSQKHPPWPKVGKSREWSENRDNEDPETLTAGAGLRGRKEQVESWSRKGAKNPQEPLVPWGPGGRVEVSCYHDCLHNSVGWAEQVIRALGFLSSVTSQLFHTGQLTSLVSASHAWKPEGCEPQSRRFFTVLKFSESSHPLTSDVIMVIFCRLHPLFSRYRASLEMKRLDDPPPVRDGI